MCDLNGPFKLCSCADDIDFSKPHWKLFRNSIGEGEIHDIMGMPIFEVHMLDVIQQKKILRRLNTINVFDFEYLPNENDKLFIHEDEDNYIEFEFKKGKWRKVEFLGLHYHFEFEKDSNGIIESKDSKLKGVYKKYLSVLNEEEEDIAICFRDSKKISEKDLIKLLESRINGKPYKFPEGYVTSLGQRNSSFE